MFTEWREKIQAMRSNQQLKDKKNVADMKICTMNMTSRTTLLQHIQNGISSSRWVYSRHRI